jgi:hypothetical protein
MSRINTDFFLWPSVQSVVDSFMRDNKEVDGVMMAHAIETRTGQDAEKGRWTEGEMIF